MNDFPGFTIIPTDKIEVTPFGSSAYIVKVNGDIIGTVHEREDDGYNAFHGFGKGAVLIGMTQTLNAAARAIVNA